MTIKELLIFNSTMSSGATIRDLLKNIRVNREIMCPLEISISTAAIFGSIEAQANSVEIHDNNVSVDITTNRNEINLITNEIGVDNG